VERTAQETRVKEKEAELALATACTHTHTHTQMSTECEETNWQIYSKRLKKNNFTAG
jgi:hypothetical protein